MKDALFPSLHKKSKKDIRMKNNPQVIRAWCIYDWANSVHALVIVSAIFPVYYGNVTVSQSGSNEVVFLGFTVKNSVLFAYSVSFAFLFIALLNPLLTAIADYSGQKKLFMKFFVYLGSFSSMLLFFFTSETLSFSMIVFVLSLIGYSGSIVFYNAYLPEIATEDQYDRISARGFAFGYVGSVLLLIFNLSMLIKPDWYGGISGGMAARVSFFTTGLWWFAFAQYTFYYLPKSDKKAPTEGRWILNGFKELKKVWKELQQLRLLKIFLLAFFFYNMGVQTVMYIAAVFGDTEIGVPDDNLILTILLIQLLAIVGSQGFAYLSARLGNTKALSIGVGIWIAICLSAYFINELGFYILAGIIGLVMGGIQSLSRSTYAKLMPEETPDKASYFGFYDVADKLSIVLGTLAYGLIEQITGSVRYSVIALAIFFIIGLFFLIQVPSRKSYHEQTG